MKTLRPLLLVCFILTSNRAFTQIQLDSFRAPLDISGHPREDEINQKGYSEVTFIAEASNDTVFYKGQFAKSLANGYGVATFTAKHEYKGEFLDGLPNGYGVATFTNGDKYEGEFLNGLYHGKGAFTFADWARFNFEYRNGQCIVGKGTVTFPNGKTCEAQCKANGEMIPLCNP